MHLRDPSNWISSGAFSCTVFTATWWYKILLEMQLRIKSTYRQSRRNPRTCLTKISRILLPHRKWFLQFPNLCPKRCYFFLLSETCCSKNIDQLHVTDIVRYSLSACDCESIVVWFENAVMRLSSFCRIPVMSAAERGSWGELVELATEGGPV
jgi:hypothetical protein